MSRHAEPGSPAHPLIGQPWRATLLAGDADARSMMVETADRSIIAGLEGGNRCGITQ
jgi:hypothetical protein